MVGTGGKDKRRLVGWGGKVLVEFIGIGKGVASWQEVLVGLQWIVCPGVGAWKTKK